MIRFWVRAYPVILAVSVICTWLAWQYLRSRGMPPEQPAVIAPTDTPASTATGTSAPDETPAATADASLTLSGRVLTAQTKSGAQGIKVVARDKGAGEGAAEGVSVITDEEGRFVFPRLEHGRTYVVAALVPAGFAVPRQMTVALEPGRAPQDCVFTWYRGGAVIYGTVRDVTPDYSEAGFAALERASSDKELEKAFVQMAVAPDRPLPNVTVTLRRDLGVRQAATDSLGRFEFTDLVAGDYEVSAEAPEGLLAGREYQSPSPPAKVRLVADSARKEVTLSLRGDAVVLKGRITDAFGRPVAWANVTGTQDREEMETGIPPPPHRVSAVSLDDGSYELRGLNGANIREALAFLMGGASWQSAHYIIRIEAAGFVPVQMRVPMVTQDLRAPAQRLLDILTRRQQGSRLLDRKPAPLPAGYGNTITGIDFVLEPPALISGKLVDPWNRPHPDRTVRLVPLQNVDAGTLVQSSVLKTRDQTDDEGNFSFPVVAAGEYAFRAGMDVGMVDIEAVRVRVRPAEARTDLRLVVEPQSPGRIEARVFDAGTGAFIDEFSASVLDVVSPGTDGPAWGQLRKGFAGPGTFSVEGIAPGKVDLQITAEGYAPERPTVEVLPGQTALLSVPLQTAGMVRVRVTQNGAPVRPTEWLAAYSTDTGSVTHGPNTPAQEGWYEIPALKEGRYVVTAQVFNGTFTRLERTSAVVEPGRASDVAIDMGGDSALVVRLSLPDRHNAQILVAPADAPGATFELPLDKNFDYCAYLYARNSGEYVVGPLRPGAYRVCARAAPADSPRKGPFREQSRTVTLEAAQTSTADIGF